MNVYVCAIKDRQLNAFLQPFFAPTLGVAQRQFSDAINNKQDPMNQHPEDYELWTLGTYDSETGRFDQSDNQNGQQQKAHRQLVLGTQLLQS